MMSMTLKTWTRLLLCVFIFACMLVQLGCTSKQAFPVANPDGDNSQTSLVSDSETSEVHKADIIETGGVQTVNVIDTSEVHTVNEASETSVGATVGQAPVIAESSSAILMFTGDLMCLSGQQFAARTNGEFDFTPSFSYVSEILQGADLVVGNLETLISPSSPYTYKMKLKDNLPNCNSMESYLKALVYAGFHAVVTANNHSLDWNMIGITETLDKLDEYQLLHTGTFAGEEEQPFILYEVNGIKVAILSYTELINGRGLLSAKQLEVHISCYSKEKVIGDVQKAKQSGADYIVAYNHWGAENTHEITKLQEQHAMEMAEAGVDLIIGSHPHCLQKAAYLTTSDGRQVLCVYSMGNFISSMAKDINNDTIVLEVNLHKVKDNVFSGAIGYYPMRVMSTYEKKYHVILPISSRFYGNSQVEKILEQARVRIRKVMGNEVSEIRY